MIQQASPPRNPPPLDLVGHLALPIISPEKKGQIPVDDVDGMPYFNPWYDYPLDLLSEPESTTRIIESLANCAKHSLHALLKEKISVVQYNKLFDRVEADKDYCMRILDEAAGKQFVGEDANFVEEKVFHAMLGLKSWSTYFRDALPVLEALLPL